jgi:hypothetical protein
LEEHPNPHATTLLGIIYAAQENNASVDIYLTNPLPQSVFLKLAEVLQANKWTLVTTRIHLLIKDISHYGTVALYDDDLDDPDDWVTFRGSGADFWNGYRATMEKNYPKVMESMRDYTYDPVIPPKTSTADPAAKSSTHGGGSQSHGQSHGGSLAGHSHRGSHHSHRGSLSSGGGYSQGGYEEFSDGGDSDTYNQLAANIEGSGPSTHYIPPDHIPHQHQQLTSSALAAFNKETTRHWPNISGVRVARVRIICARLIPL